MFLGTNGHTLCLYSPYCEFRLKQQCRVSRTQWLEASTQETWEYQPPARQLRLPKRNPGSEKLLM